ncbi:MAG: hypothetical protein V4607_08295 [Pseudomonadota bacterium]
MFKKTVVLTLSLISSAAIAQVAATLPVVGPLVTGIANGLTVLPTTPGTGALGITALTNGADGSGVGQTLGLGLGGGQTPDIIGQQLNNRLVTPLVGLDGNNGALAVGAVNGNNTTNAGPGGLAAVAALSGNDNANGGAISAGIINGNNTGNGNLIGLGVLSGSGSGTASEGLGVGVLNTGDPLSITAGGQSAGLNTITSQAQSSIPATPLLPGIQVGGSEVTTSNPALNAGVLAGNNAGNGGAIGVAVLSGDNTAQSSGLGVGVLNGSNSGSGEIAAGVLNGSNSGNGNTLGAGVLNGNDSGNGGVIGGGVLNGSGSGNGGTLGAGVLNEGNSGNGGVVGGGVLNGPGSGNGGTVGVGVANGANTSGGNGGGDGSNSPGNNGTGNQSDEEGDKLCPASDQKKNRSSKLKETCVPKVKVAQKN